MRLATIADVEAAMAKPPLDPVCEEADCGKRRDHWSHRPMPVGDRDESRHHPFVPPLTETQVLPASNRDEARSLVARMARRRSREEADRTRDQLIEDIAISLRLLRTTDGHQIRDVEIDAKARNLACGLLGSYRIERLP